MIGELFQQQAKRLEAQLYQQLRDKKQIELVHSQLVATSKQLQALQQQNSEQSKLIASNEEAVRAMYEQARIIQRERNQIAQICEHFLYDVHTLRQTLATEAPERFSHLTELPLEQLPPSQVELPPLEEIIPKAIAAAGDSIAPNHLQNHAETALALLSTVASHKSNEHQWNNSHGSDDGSSNGGESKSSGGDSNNGSSNNGTEDTVLCPHDARSRSVEGASSTGSDGNGDGQGSDSGKVDSNSNGSDCGNGDGQGSESGSGHDIEGSPRDNVEGHSGSGECGGSDAHVDVDSTPPDSTSENSSPPQEEDPIVPSNTPSLTKGKRKRLSSSTSFASSATSRNI